MLTRPRFAALLPACACAVILVARSPASITQTIAVGSSPFAVAVNSVTNKIYVANYLSSTVTIVDGATNIISAIATGLYPSAIAVNEQTNKIYVANAGSNTVTVIDGSTNSTSTIAVKNNPTSLAINSITNEVYVANTYSASVTVIHAATGLTDSIAVGGYPWNVAINQTTNKIYVANAGDNTVSVINGVNHAVQTAVPTDIFPMSLAVNAITNKVYVANFTSGTLTVIDGDTNATSSLPAGPSPAAVAVNQATDRVFVTNYTKPGSITIIEGATARTITIPAGSYPLAMVLNPTTGTVYVANHNDRSDVASDVTVVNGVSAAAWTVGAGRSPTAVAVNPVTNKTYVANYADGTVTVIAGNSFSPMRYVPVTPCRVVDTRNANGPLGGPALTDHKSRDFVVPSSACGIPTIAAAFTLNVTVVPHGSVRYLTVWPAGGSQPLASTLNSLDGRVKANAAIVPAGTNGGVTVLASMLPSNATTDLILDISGYFIPERAATDLAFYPVVPCRVMDTRGPNGILGGPALRSQETRTIPLLSSNCNLASNARAFSLNFTAIPKARLGFLTAWPSDEIQPNVSTLNAGTGTVTANAAIVPADQNGSINVFVTGATDLLIDVNGYFAPGDSGANPQSLYTVAPCRVLDTRQSGGAFLGALAPPVNSSASGCDVPTTAQAVVFNATAIPPGRLGFLTLWPDGQSRPTVSTLNALDGAITNNLAIVPVADGFVDAFSSSLTNLVLDVFSYFAP